MQFRSFQCAILIVVFTVAVRSRAADVSPAPHPPATAPAAHADAAAATLTRRIVYVCDVSESMKTKMPALQRELSKAIVSLHPIQGFDILLMGQGDPVLFAPAIVGATPAHKRQAVEFIDKISAGGARGTMAALDLAIRWQPYRVYLLVDRDFPTDAVRARLHEINSDHKVGVSVVVLAASTDGSGDWLDHLKKLAEENGGLFRRMDTDPHSRLFGYPGDARKIAYVGCVSLHLDYSLKREMSKAIAALPATAEFSILFTSQEHGEAFPNDSTLLPATPENQQKAEAFLNKAGPALDTDPSGSLTLAFSKHPQLICLVCDDEFPDNQATIAKIAALNKDKRVKINTIAFKDANDTRVGFFDVLEKIAKDNGGTFRIVKEDEL